MTEVEKAAEQAKAIQGALKTLALIMEQVAFGELKKEPVI